MSKHSYADLSFTALPTSACGEVYEKFKRSACITTCAGNSR
jgi:hypothetical protein